MSGPEPPSAALPLYPQQPVEKQRVFAALHPHRGGRPCPRWRHGSSRVPAAHGAGQGCHTVWSSLVLNYTLILNLSFFPETPDW